MSTLRIFFGAGDVNVGFIFLEAFLASVGWIIPQPALFQLLVDAARLMAFSLNNGRRTHSL